MEKKLEKNKEEWQKADEEDEDEDSGGGADEFL